MSIVLFIYDRLVYGMHFVLMVLHLDGYVVWMNVCII